MSNGILERENEERSIAMLAAQRQLYSDAKYYNIFSISLAVWIPFALAILMEILPENLILKNSLRAVSLISMCGCFCINKCIASKKKLAAYIQQKFDVYVYSMVWDTKCFGVDKNVDYDIVDNAKEILCSTTKKEKLMNWYTPAVDDKDLLDGILLCQKENCWWDVGLRKRFRCSIVILIVLLIIIVFGIGVFKGETVSELLIRLAFIAPMLYWALNTVEQINRDIADIEEIDVFINDNQVKKMEDLQIIQKLIFEHRKNCYLIPDIVNDLFKNNNEDKAHRIARLQ